MIPIRILNLYACLGGNRLKWDEVEIITVTAVEHDAELARLYKERFPNDIVIVADAHSYLLQNYKEFDFIWSSPPCPSHSRARAYNPTFSAVYPDFTLYQQIVFLENYFPGLYCVENVIPYYEPLIPAKKRGRHLFWTNFLLPADLDFRESPSMGIGNKELSSLYKFHEISLSSYKGNQKCITIARNLMDYQAGKTVLEAALGIYKAKETKQLEIVF